MHKFGDKQTVEKQEKESAEKDFQNSVLKAFGVSPADVERAKRTGEPVKIGVKKSPELHRGQPVANAAVKQPIKLGKRKKVDNGR